MLVVQNITKRYGCKIALENCSFTLEPGTVVGLIGENGAGKSTLLQGLCGLQKVSGEMFLNGINYQKLPRAKRLEQIGFMSDANCLPLHLSASRLISLYDTIYQNFKIVPWLNYLPLNQSIANLSKGMRAQLHLSLTLGQNQPVLMMDEPTLGLDLIAREAFYSYLLEYCSKKDKIVIVSSHQVEELENFINHVIFMQDGRVILDGKKSTLLNKYSITETKLQHHNLVYEFKYFDKEYYMYKQKIDGARSPSLKEIFIAYGRQK